MLQNINLNGASVSAELHAILYDYLYGYNGVFAYGRKLAYEIVTNNEIKLYDGIICNQGRFMRIVTGSYETITIENGASGTNRTDLIVAHFETDGITETHDIRVLKGTTNYTTGNIHNGDTVNELPLYEVKLEGLTITKVTPLFSTLYSFNELRHSVANVNLLVNGDFKNAINQRGSTKYTGTTAKCYTIDRWCMGDQDYDRTVEIVSGTGVKITNPNTTHVGTFQQLIEKSLSKANYTVTVKVVELNGSAILSCGGAQKELKLGVNTLTVNSAVDSVKIFVAPTSNITLDYAKLEVGTIATPFVPVKYDEELRKCQRYYESSTLYMPMIFKNSTTQAKFSGNYMIPKRGSTTVTCSNIQAYKSGEAFMVASSHEVIGNTSTGFMLRATFPSTLTDGSHTARVTMVADSEMY